MSDLRPRLTVVFQALVWSVSTVGLWPTAHAIDLEAFEFDDSNETELSFAANSVTDHMWTTSETGGVSDMLPSDVRSGNYRVIKDFDGLAENWLQIDNVTSGKVYLVAHMSSWAFRQALPDDPNEEIRFGFLNEDTGTSGNTITAEMQIRRNSSGDIELFGRALGAGASLIADTVTLANDQTDPFTAVLEADFDTDTYKVFYKDGSNPSQVLGQGAIAPTRDANSVRFAANNNFGSTNFFPTVIDEQFLIDRIAVADSNPLTDLVNVVIDRDNGSVTLTNNTGAALPNLESIAISSAVGSLNPADWKPVTGNYDNSPGGNGLVDNDGTWSIVTSTPTELTETSDGGDGGTLEIGATVVLSMGDGAWLQNPFEDVSVTLGFAGGITRTANVIFEGNDSSRFSIGDLDFDGQLTVNDWSLLMQNGESDLQGLTQAQSYRLGDLNGDMQNNILDVGIFKDVFDSEFGEGAFELMIANQVPEPNSAILLTFGLLSVAAYVRCCHRRPVAAPAPSYRGNRLGIGIRHSPPFLALATCMLLAASNARAEILEDFTFSDVNGATLGEVDNSANPGNLWTEETAVMTESAVANPPGVFRIQKANDNFGRNYLDIANITTGQAWLVAEIAGWSFSSIVGSPDFDSAELEDIRFDFLNNDGAAIGGSTITAGARIQRNTSGDMEITGTALGGGTDIAATPLSLTQSQPFTVALELDQDSDTYQIFVKDGSNPFMSIGTGNISADRDANSVRFGVNNNFSGTDEFFDIDRIYLTNESPIVDAVDPLTLKVNLGSGQVWIANDSTVPYAIDSYRITDANPNGALSVSGWNSLSDQGIDAVDGPADPDSTVGNGIGETWEEAGGANSKALAESFLFGSSTIQPTEQLSLGQAITPGSDPDLGFEFRRTDTGAILVGLIEFVTGDNPPGDYNDDGIVNAADYTVWRDNVGAPAGTLPNDIDGGTIGQAQYDTWKGNFGTTNGSGSAALQSVAVPEPNPTLAAIVFAIWAGVSQRRICRAKR